MFILIENGDIHDPAPRGRGSILVANDRIERVGAVDRRGLDALGVDYEVIDAEGAVVAPGIIDPHEHLLGGSGEGGFALQTPMLFPREIVRAGVTTVVGTLGVDTTMKTVEGLLARVKALHDEGLTAFMWTGGYNVPPTTILGSVREDMLVVREVIGAGEVAIADERGLGQPSQELAKLVRDTHVGGLLSGKAGVTHFHVGEEDVRLRPLRELIDDFQVKPEWLYPTHVQRDEKLLGEAIALAKHGASVDFDCVEEDIAKWLRFYLDHDGPTERLTLSSDADSSTPDILYQQLRGLVLDHRHPLELVLRLVTANPARILALPAKGHIAQGCDADILVLDRNSLEIREVIARGHRMVVDGQVVIREKYLAKSKRAVAIVGDEAPEEAIERASREAPDAAVTGTLGGGARS